MSSIVHKTLSLTPELAERLDADRATGTNISALVERLLRTHYQMPPRPALPDGRFTPGERRTKKVQPDP